MTQDLNQTRDRIMTIIAAASTLEALEACRVEMLGKQGTITALLNTLGKMTPAQRQVHGPLIQGLREAVANGIAEHKATLVRQDDGEVSK